MYHKMEINDYERDVARFQKIADPVLAGLPDDIKGRPHIDGNYLSFRIFFGTMETDFYISAKGTIVYWIRDEAILQDATRADVLREHEGYLMAKKALEGCD